LLNSEQTKSEVAQEKDRSFQPHQSLWLNYVSVYVCSKIMLIIII
jgi:hypothetical protein